MPQKQFRDRALERITKQGVALTCRLHDHAVARQQLLQRQVCVIRQPCCFRCRLNSGLARGMRCRLQHIMQKIMSDAFPKACQRCMYRLRCAPPPPRQSRLPPATLLETSGTSIKSLSPKQAQNISSTAWHPSTLQLKQKCVPYAGEVMPPAVELRLYSMANSKYQTAGQTHRPHPGDKRVNLTCNSISSC